MIELYGDYTRDLHSGKVGYNFTIRVVSGTPPLSHICEACDDPRLTSLGETILGKIKEVLPPEIEMKCAILMPDHLHLCLWVKAPLKLTILQILTKVLLFSEKQLRETASRTTLWQRPGHLFQCYSWDVLQQKIAYDQGNVLRWKMDHAARERSHPHLVTHPKLPSVYAWEGYGELTLLDGTHFLPCYISSQASADAIAHFTTLATKLATAGWTLIGGFVSDQERTLLKTVREATTPRVIHLAASRLTDTKVAAKLAEALYTGHFLRLTSAEGQETCTRDLCVWHNLWIEAFCGDWRTAVETHFRQTQSLTEAQERYIHDFLTRWRAPLKSKYKGPRTLP